MENKKEKKVFTSINNLKNLSNVPEGKKKRRMTKYVNLLTHYLDLYKESYDELTKIKKAFNLAQPITSLDTYKIKQKLYSDLAEVENLNTSLKSNISKYINVLLIERCCQHKNINKITADELYGIVVACENKEFKNNYFPRRRLRLLLKNNIALKKFQFENEVINQVSKRKFEITVLRKTKYKPHEYWLRHADRLQKKIDACLERQASLNDTFKSMEYAKLIKRFDKASHKSIKHYMPIAHSEYVIDFKNVTKYYYNKWMAAKILKGIDLQIKQGEFVVILGPSGSGKTTLLNIMSGMDKATYGRTIVNSNNLIKMTDNQLTEFRKDNIGYIFQQYGLLPNLTVRENVEMGWNLQSNKSKRLDVDELLKTVSMSEHANKFPHELSGGQQQRVSVARSMAKNPAIVFGDEPTGAVDEEMSKQILQLFVDINNKFNTTVIIVTHNPIFADLATRVIKVNSGMIAQNYENKNRKSVNELDWSSTH